MTAAWVTIVALIVGTNGTKVISVLALGAHPPGERMLRITALAAPALLAALVVYETVSASGRGIQLDARIAGLTAAVAAIWLRRSMITVVLVAAAVAACVRLIT